MPHCKCVACRVRLRMSGSPAELGGDRCPECGSLVEPVADPAELIGYRSIKTLDSAADVAQSGSGKRIADRVDEFAQRREAILERDRLDSEHWLDDSDDRRAVAVALPLPPTNL